MAKTNKKTGNNAETKKTASTYEPVPMTNIPRTASPMPSSSQQSSTGTGTLNRPSEAVKSKAPVPPTHKQIEDRAGEIWHRKGCPIGQDEQNWLDAEAELKKEMGIK
jgi:hypothetical protein